MAALNLKLNETIIEIGPGNGELTFPLAEECKKIGCKLIGVEKDPILVDKLTNLKINKLKILKGDVLKLLPKINKTYKLKNLQTYKLVGNIPYYITGKLLRVLSELENKPQLTILMIQKEVAERLTAQPPQMNLLAAAVQFWAEPKILFTLKPGDFNPPPKVESAVIYLTPKPPTLSSNTYYQFIHAAFKQPRKTLVNNLRIGLKKPKNEIENALRTAKIDLQARPQNLSINEIKLLTTLLL